MEQNSTTASEANRLYWQTDRSVADIAETLSVSRRALYELIDPESTGNPCNACGGDVVFTNRSAKASSTGRCAQCGIERDTTSVEPEAEEILTPYAAGWPRVVQRQGSAANDDVRSRAFRLGGAAIAGAALGAIATLLIVRRR